tara:strand:- start:1376 stop:1648 length:273 start_codon:yes stop_codon:yes gene_type:complete
MSLVGKPVLSTWGANIRYGVVVREEARGKWKHCTVDWVNDETYIESISHLNSLRSDGDHTKHIYRVDELLFIDVDKQLKDLRVIKKKLRR